MELQKIFARAETGAERPLAALWVDSIRILSCFAGESGGRGDYAELQVVSKLFSEGRNAEDTTSRTTRELGYKPIDDLGL